MRTHPIASRLGYSLGWPAKLLPGRPYQPQFLRLKDELERGLGSFLGQQLLAPWLLLSHLTYRFYADGRCSANAYVYLYRYNEALERLAPRRGVEGPEPEGEGRWLAAFLLQDYARPLLAGLLFLLQETRPRVQLNLVLVVDRFFRAELVTQYILGQLLNRFKISRLVPLLGRHLLGRGRAEGLLVHCAGRFDRKERASHHVYSYGRTRVGRLASRVSYRRDQVTLKYGVCGLKVWLLKRRGSHPA